MNLWQVSFRKVAVSYIFLLRHWHTEYPFFLHFLDVFVKIFVLFFGTNEKFRIFVLLLEEKESIRSVLGIIQSSGNPQFHNDNKDNTKTLHGLLYLCICCLSNMYAYRRGALCIARLSSMGILLNR